NCSSVELLNLLSFPTRRSSDLNYASNEKLRSSVLESYNLPHSCSDPDYDELTFLTATLCKVPVAFISIIEPSNICFKAKYGLSRSEEHTSELQSRENLVCRLLL